MTPRPRFAPSNLRVRSVARQIMMCGLFLVLEPTIVVFASDTWIGGTASPSWAAGANWSTGSVPVSGDDAIMVGPGQTTNKTDIGFYLHTVQFPSGGPGFHVQVTSAINIGDSFGGGIINNSGVAQFFDVQAKHVLGDWLLLDGGSIGTGVQIINFGSTISGDDPQSGGNTQFFRTASAGTAVIYNNAAEANLTASGKTTFYDQSSSGAALIVNLGATGDFGGGSTTFRTSSTAANAAIINEAGTSAGAYGGSTYFNDSSSVGDARIANNGSGVGSSTSLYGGVGTTFVEGGSIGSAIILNHGGGAANAYGGYTQIDFSAAGTASITNEAGAAGAFGGETVFNVQASAGNASIANNGGGGDTTRGGETTFYGSSTAGNATITNNATQNTSAFSGQTTFNGASAGSATINNNGSNLAFSSSYTQQGGVTFFQSTATAVKATIINNGGTATFYSAGGETIFGDSSDAGNATLIAYAGIPGSTNGIIFRPGGLGGAIFFNGGSTGGTARIELFGNGNLDISFHNPPGVGTGSIEGTGSVFLGANNLTVGGNNRSTIFSGFIQDGGANGGSGGAFTKTGTGKLTLTNANIYTGVTTIKNGSLLASNQSGSATGTGALRVTSGTLGGAGMISGQVTVGNGKTAGANLQGGSGTKAGTLTINNGLRFNSGSTYRCYLNRTTTPKAGTVTARGVTINANVPFTFVETGTAALSTGTKFTVINNTSANPISGRFSNLPNGSTFTDTLGTTFKVSYSGGTGNDLVLTVQ